MTWLDYAVIGVLAVSVAWGIWRGLVREVVSLWPAVAPAAPAPAAPAAVPWLVPDDELLPWLSAVADELLDGWLLLMEPCVFVSVPVWFVEVVPFVAVAVPCGLACLRVAPRRKRPRPPVPTSSAPRIW